MTTETPATTKKQAYNMNGTIAGMTVRQDKNGADYVTFDLIRAKSDKPQRCVAFGDPAAVIMGLKPNKFGETLSKQDGDALHVLGVYDGREFKGQKDGKMLKSFDMTVLFASEPRAPKAVEPAAA